MLRGLERLGTPVPTVEPLAELEPHKDIQIAKLGRTVITSSHFTDKIDNTELLQRAIDAGLPPEDYEKAESIVKATGITHRAITPSLENASPEFILERTSQVGAYLLRAAMKEAGIKKIDTLIDTSAFLSKEINERILIRAGLDPNDTDQFSYRVACAGFVAAFIDTLANPALQDKVVAIASLEPLSARVDQRQYTLKEFPTPSIFGDGYGVTLFRPSDYSLREAKVFVQDDGGVIKIDMDYDYASEVNRPDLRPSYYEIAAGSEDIIKYTENGVFLNQKKPTNGMRSEMDGVATGLYFGDTTADVVDKLSKKAEITGNDPIFKEKRISPHIPGLAAYRRMAREMMKKGYLEDRNLPFYLKNMEESNMSSFTAMAVLQYLVEIQPPEYWSEDFLMVAPGAGSMIAAGIVRHNYKDQQ